MGVDIHMSIINKDKYIKKEIFDGRDSEWFMDLQGNGWDSVYDNFPIEYGIPEECPSDIKDDYSDKHTYYDFRYISVVEAIDWLAANRPWIDAGWATSYERWSYVERGIIPNDGFPHYIPTDEDGKVLPDYHFIQYDKKYDNGKWLYKYLTEQLTFEEKNKGVLIYYFDC